MIVLVIIAGCAAIAMIAFVWYELKHAIEVDGEGYVLDKDGKRTGARME